MDEKTRELIKVLFFIKEMTVKDISKELGFSEKSIGALLRKDKRYQKEREKRKKANAIKRKEYKRNWDRQNRKKEFNAGEVNAASIKREHEVAVNILSHEKY